MQGESKQRRMEPNERREEILDAAQALFTENGWEAVTVADVLEAAGISRGGFYHHFTAKDDLLAGIVTRMTRQGLAAAEMARRKVSGNALAKLNAFLTGSVRWKADNVEEMRFFADVLTKPGNDILYRRVFDATAAAVLHVLEGMIAEGVADTTFDVADARLTAELIVALSHGRRQVLDDATTLAALDIDKATGQLDARMRAEGATCDRLLGLPPGSVALPNPCDYRRMLVGLVTTVTSPHQAPRTNGPVPQEKP